MKMDITPEELQQNLKQFCGTEQYYPSSFRRLRLTDGVHYLRMKANCFWLVDIIESYHLKEPVKSTPFQVWKLTVDLDKHTGKVVCEDGNNNQLIEQELKYTDFPLEKMELWCIDGVVLLPNEY